MGRKAVPADQPTERRMASDVFFFSQQNSGGSTTGNGDDSWDIDGFHGNIDGDF